MNKNFTYNVNELLKITDELNQIKDIDQLLEKVLYETRKLTNADAGSIFLRKKNKLDFRYVQNDTLRNRNKSNKKLIYSNFSIPIDEKSIAGYTALKGETTIINDVYNLEPDVPYTFNDKYDKLSNYRTVSTMTIPLKVNNLKTIGVMQIINKLDKNGNPAAFTKNDEKLINYFANNATTAIEKAKMTREMILRMIKMAELRDPKETGAHVNRVGAYSIEIYDRYARDNSLLSKEISSHKDILRIAAMLHDVGKVAISDTILKKPARLTSKEFKIMQTHTSKGAELFHDNISELDKLSAEIALNHHEKFDGSGYPHGLKGKNIPLNGRIVALADVYDALISKRVYKPAWDEEKVLALLNEESGSHFDPELVEVFMSIYDIIKAIREKFPDE